jgi:hypothetical protein
MDGVVRYCRPFTIQADFSEHKENLRSGPKKNYTQTVLTQDARTITVFVKNTGRRVIHAYLQNSPDGENFVTTSRCSR